MKSAAFLASAALLAFQATPAAAVPVMLAGGSAWHVDYGANQCAAVSTYQLGGSPVVLGLVPSIGGDRYKILVSVPQAGPAFAQQTKGSVDFGAGPIVSQALYYGGTGVPLSVRQFEVSAAILEQARSAGGLAIRSADGANYTFALSNMSNVIDSLRTCSADLQRYWNAQHGQNLRPASSRAADLRSLYTPADLPGGNWYRSPLSLSQARSTAFELLVDERGQVAGCEALNSTGAPLLETSFCTAMRDKARFKPAMDASGRPVRSLVTTASVDWGNFNELNTGCLWITGSSYGVLNNCGLRPTSALPSFVPPPPTTVTTPPPPPATH